MENRIDDLVQDVLQMLLTGKDGTIGMLRHQLETSIRTPREMTGAGFFINFEFPNDVMPLPGNSSFSFGDVAAEVDGLEFGAGFVLHVRDGILSFFEGYSYQEPWPSVIKSYQLSYLSGADRDLGSLEGWPNSAPPGMP